MGTYKTSTIRLYQATPSSNWELLPHKLFIVDDIESYLATKTFNTYTLVQYQKPTLELSIVLDLSQTYAEPLNSGFKYARIENSDDTGHYYYYFIKSIDWRAKSAVRFNLVMDVLNTFKEGTHYSFKDSTKITREHKDRFTGTNVILTIENQDELDALGTLAVNDSVNVYYNDEGEILILNGKITSIEDDVYKITAGSSYSLSQVNASLVAASGSSFTIAKNTLNYIIFNSDNYSATANLYRNIDYIPENINPILQCEDASGIKVEHNKIMLREDWFLLYRNTNDPDPNEYVNPVECYLIPAVSMRVSTGSVTSGQITPASLEYGKLYYFPIYCRGITDSYISFPAYDQSITLSNNVNFSGHTYTNEVSYLVVAKTENGDLNVLFNKLVYDSDSGAARFSVSSQIIYDNISYITINQSPTYYNDSATSGLTVIQIFESLLSTLNRKSLTYSETGYSLNSIDDLDRTQAKNIKLIKLPYCPYDFPITSSKIDISNTEWEYSTISQPDHSVVSFHALRLMDLNTKLKTTFTSVNPNPYSNLFYSSLAMTNPLNTDLRRGSIYESKLFNSEFYRPTFYYDSFQFVIQLEKCNLSYYINSYSSMTVSFIMTRTINSKFMLSFDNYYLRNATESYATYMPIARNNEEVLYNVPYINYIRTGYNYDIKNRNLSNVSNAIGLGLSTVGMAASFVVPSAPLKALGIVTSLISMAMTVKNTISTAVSNQMSIDRKLQEAKMQTASVSGSDDVDLMSEYAENRVKYLVYEPTAIMKNMLYNLFFFAGYNSQRMGLPSHNTRLNFDYLECDAVIEKTANIPDDCLSELINSFKNGVTYIHKTNRTTDKWDFEQKYEHWEISLGVE